MHVLASEGREDLICGQRIWCQGHPIPDSLSQKEQGSGVAPHLCRLCSCTASLSMPALGSTLQIDHASKVTPQASSALYRVDERIRNVTQHAPGMSGMAHCRVPT